MQKNESLNESFFDRRKAVKKFTHTSSNKKQEAPKQAEKTFKGAMIYTDEPCNNIDERFKLCDDHWDEIMEDAARVLLGHLKGYPNENIPEKDKTKSGMKKYIKLSDGTYYSDKNNRLDLSFDIKFDDNHFIDTSIKFDDGSKISIDSVFEG